MVENSWDAEKMLDVYIYDYFMKRNFHASAKAFSAERKVPTDPVAIDAPGGFLLEWWSVFWDIFIARTSKKHSETATAYIEGQQLRARERQQNQAHMQLLELAQKRNPHLLQRDAPYILSPLNPMNRECVIGPSAKMFDERMRNHDLPDLASTLQLVDAGLLHIPNTASMMVPRGHGNASMGQPDTWARGLQIPDSRGLSNLGRNQSASTDPRMFAASEVPHLKSAHLSSVSTNSGQQSHDVQSPNLLQQLQLLPLQQQQQFLAQAQAHGNLGSSIASICGDTHPSKITGLRVGLTKDIRPTESSSSQHSGLPVQATAVVAHATSEDRLEKLIKVPEPLSQQGQLQQQQLRQNSQKRKKPSESRTGAGNTTGPSPNSPPSTSCTHTPGDGMSVAFALPPKGSKDVAICHPDGAGALGSSSGQMDDLEDLGDMGSFDDNIESFLSHDDGDGRDASFHSLKRSLATKSNDPLKGFTFSEVGCLRYSNSKVLCCHFSSDGKLLASAGHDKKAVLWNMDTLDLESTLEEHSSLITDVCFRPNSSHLATSSFDKTVRVWNAANPSYSLCKLSGHETQVKSLDFHPKKPDLLCSCDSNGEIRWWNVNQQACTRVSKQGGISQLRFQPIAGQLMATSEENMINIFDVETNRCLHTLKGHIKEVSGICWDTDGEYLASVSEDCVRIWSLKSSGGDCVRQLTSKGNKLQSCVFHPSYPMLLIVGGYQTLELWSSSEGKSMSVQAHDNLIAALARSPNTGMVASASHDKCVKLWK
ncbi:hypothetical protein AMTRI_Chr02g258170 [Amborella trichopoda]